MAGPCAIAPAAPSRACMLSLYIGSRGGRSLTTSWISHEGKCARRGVADSVLFPRDEEKQRFHDRLYLIHSCRFKFSNFPLPPSSHPEGLKLSFFSFSSPFSLFLVAGLCPVNRSIKMKTARWSAYGANGGKGRRSIDFCAMFYLRRDRTGKSLGSKPTIFHPR